MRLKDIKELAALPDVERIEVREDGTVVIVKRQWPPFVPNTTPYAPFDPLVPSLPENPFWWVQPTTTTDVHVDERKPHSMRGEFEVQAVPFVPNRWEPQRIC